MEEMFGGRDLHLKKAFLITMIFSLSISALIGIIIFLIGNIGEIEMRILLTTLAIGGFSLTGLVSASLHDKKKFVPFAWIGIFVVILGFFISLFVIWEPEFGSEALVKTEITLIVFTIDIAHTSLLLFIDSRRTFVNVFLFLTIFFVFLISLQILSLVWFEYNPESIWWRLLGVFAILDVLGTIVVPLSHKLTKVEHPA